MKRMGITVIIAVTVSFITMSFAQEIIRPSPVIKPQTGPVMQPQTAPEVKPQVVPMTKPLPVMKPQIVPAQTLEIQNLTLQKRLQLVGKSQVIRGFYSNKSVPLIVDDINRMMVREVMPPGTYILLAGAIPANVRHGDKVEVQGVITRPSASDPKHLRGEQTILKLSGAANAIKVITQSTLRPQVAVSPEITKQLVTASSKYKIKVLPGTLPHLTPTHYAVLINGGVNAANNWISFYNDLVANYNMLIGRGYSPANITVINADGGGSFLMDWGVVHDNYAATATNVDTVFKQLAAKMTALDTLYVMITDHGSPGAICLWGENMSGALFGSMINRIKNYSQMTFSFDLCFSGGLIPNVMGVNRIIIAACDANKSAFDSSHGPFGALNYAVISALTGMTPAAGSAVNADANADGNVSLAETFNYVRGHIDSGGAPQTPHYNDDVAPSDTTGELPQGTDGILGATRYL